MRAFFVDGIGVQIPFDVPVSKRPDSDGGLVGPPPEYVLDNIPLKLQGVEEGRAYYKLNLPKS